MASSSLTAAFAACLVTTPTAFDDAVVEARAPADDPEEGVGTEAVEGNGSATFNLALGFALGAGGFGMGSSTRL